MARKVKEVRVDDELAKDPNYIAYQQALKAGDFEKLEPGTWVAFNKGQLVATNIDRGLLFKALDEQKIGGFVHQVGVPERVVDLPSPLWVGPARRHRSGKH